MRKIYFAMNSSSAAPKSRLTIATHVKCSPYLCSHNRDCVDSDNVFSKYQLVLESQRAAQLCTKASPLLQKLVLLLTISAQPHNNTKLIGNALLHTIVTKTEVHMGATSQLRLCSFPTEPGYLSLGLFSLSCCNKLQCQRSQYYVVFILKRILHTIQKCGSKHP